MGLRPGAKGSRKRVSFKVPPDLWNEYQNVKKLAAEKGYIFDPTPELTEALKKSLKRAREELEGANS